jgi:type II secretory pathway component PulM
MSVRRIEHIIFNCECRHEQTAREALDELRALVAALQPFADQADMLDAWTGGPPTPAHAFRDEMVAAREALR